MSGLILAMTLAAVPRPSLAALPGPLLAAPMIPYADENKAPQELVQSIKARRTGGKLLNLDRMLLNSPEFAKGWNSMFGAIRGKLVLPGMLREIAIMSIGVLNHADYEWLQHEPVFLKVGGTQAQLAALKKGDDAPFDEAGKATLALTREMTRDVKVRPETMKRIRAVLPNDQVVELIGTIAGYNMVSRFVVATGVEAE
jgi:alkylhydroperoxidase family enzyme